MIESIDTPYIHAGTDENFAALAIENSSTGPVLLNFWSKKAGPCLRQYPILDKIIHQFNGRMLLININVDTEYKVTKEYGIASVPTLKLLRHQKIVDTWFGYQSEADLVRNLDKYVNSKSAQALRLAISKYTEGEQSEALEIIANAIVVDPNNVSLPAAMCKILIFEQRHSDAKTLIESLPVVVRNDESIKQIQSGLDAITDVKHPNNSH